MNHRDRSAPIALARYSPIAQLVCDGAAPKAMRLGVCGHRRVCFLGCQSTPLASVNGGSPLLVGRFQIVRSDLSALRIQLDLPKREAILAGEFKVALVA